MGSLICNMTQEEVWALRSLVGLQSKELEEKIPTWTR